MKQKQYQNSFYRVFFTKSPQYKNASIANFLLVVLPEINWTMKSGTLK